MTLYVFDTNSLRVLCNYYPRQFPTFWKRLDAAVQADPFIVAIAKARDGTVVTEEVKKENAAKIPNVCEHFRVPCLNLEGFLTQHGWSF